MTTIALDAFADVLPKQRDLYYGGRWQTPAGGYAETVNPATGERLGKVAEANADDVEAAVEAARGALRVWNATSSVERARLLKRVDGILWENSAVLGFIDAANCGDPVTNTVGFTTEIEGATIPMGTDRDPYGICARIVAYNHPLYLNPMKLGVPLAAGNTLIIKPPPQAALSVLRMMELLDGELPAGVLNVITGRREAGEALVARVIARGAADRLRHVLFEQTGRTRIA